MQYVPIGFWTHDLTLHSYMWEKELLLETWFIGIDFEPYANLYRINQFLWAWYIQYYFFWGGGGVVWGADKIT